MRWFFKRFWLPFYRRWALRYVRQERRYSIAGLRLNIPSGVFHPGIYFSTPIFLRFLQQIDFQGKTVLDVGTGSGLLALFAAQKGAHATALDLNPKAVATARQNAAANGLGLEVLESDLFAALPPGRTFDLLLVNPPYYPSTPRDPAELAFFAGESLDYFERFFEQVGAICHPQSATYFILSEDCPWDNIQEIAARHGYALSVVFEQKKWGERFFVAQTAAV